MVDMAQKDGNPRLPGCRGFALLQASALDRSSGTLSVRSRK